MSSSGSRHVTKVERGDRRPGEPNPAIARTSYLRDSV